MLFLLFAGHAPRSASLQLIGTRRVVFVAQTILALPVHGRADRRRRPGAAGRACCLRRGCSAPAGVSCAALALREARIGVIAAVIAALGSALSEVAAIAILGGNIYGYNQTLASATLYEVNGGHYAEAVAIAIVLAALILVLMGGLAMLQQQDGGIRLRFRSAT